MKGIGDTNYILKFKIKRSFKRDSSFVTKGVHSPGPQYKLVTKIENLVISLSKGAKLSLSMCPQTLT